MPFQLKLDPILGQEDQYSTLFKSELLHVCDLLIATFDKHIEKFRDCVDGCPIRNKDENLEPVTLYTRDKYTHVTLFPWEQKRLGVAESVISVAELIELSKCSTPSTLKEYFSALWLDIRLPNRKPHAIWLAYCCERHDQSTWNEIKDQLHAVQKNNVLQEQILVVMKLREIVSAHKFDRFIIGDWKINGLIRCLNQMEQLAGDADFRRLNMVHLFEQVIDPACQESAHGILYEYAVNRSDGDGKKTDFSRGFKPPDVGG